VNDDLDLLIELYLSGSAGEADVRRLEDLLRSDPQAVQVFVLALDEDVSLRKSLSFEGEEKALVAAAEARAAGRRNPLRAQTRPPQSIWAPLLAGAMLFMALILWVSVSDPGTARELSPQARPRRPQPGREEERRRAQLRLAEIERERRLLEEGPAPVGGKPEGEKEKAQHRRLTELNEETLRVERDLQSAADTARLADEGPARTQEIPPPDRTRDPAPVPAPRSQTQVELPAAIIDRIEGSVFVISPEEKVEAVAGARLKSGCGIETAGSRSAAVLCFPDGTRLELGGDTSIRDLSDSSAQRGKRLAVVRGSLRSRVVRQAAGSPMVIATPHGEARVLGTIFRLLVDAGSTRLEVTEGKVQLRRSDGKTQDVAAGHFSVASAVGELAARPLPVDDIVLVPDPLTKVMGVEWKVVKDPATATGLALETLETAYKLKRSGDTFTYDSVKNRNAYVLFSFMADAGKDYHVWIRGRTLASTQKRFHDEVAIEPLNGQLSQKCRQLGWTGDNAFCFTGYCLYSGYGWIGGYGEDGVSDAVPLSIRFPRPGLQTLKLYAIESPVRIDAIWLSASQGARPTPDQRPPAREGK
jgi:ferric-dicitrate binding protein FerR (iron transport regulator)